LNGHSRLLGPFKTTPRQTTRTQKPGVMVVDNLELLGGLDFSDQNWTTEHYGYNGRLQIAKQLAKALH